MPYMHHIAILHDVILAFETELALGARGGRALAQRSSSSGAAAGRLRAWNSAICAALVSALSRAIAAPGSASIAAWQRMTSSPR